MSRVVSTTADISEIIGESHLPIVFVSQCRGEHDAPTCPPKMLKKKNPTLIYKPYYSPLPVILLTASISAL
jgi:hypothetical protein